VSLERNKLQEAIDMKEQACSLVLERYNALLESSGFLAKQVEGLKEENVELQTKVEASLGKNAGYEREKLDLRERNLSLMEKAEEL